MINTVAHFYTVAHITSLTALKQIDPRIRVRFRFAESAVLAHVPRVSPCRSACQSILDIAVYIFVNALTTVSAVIFLYGAGTKLAAIAIVHMDEAGVLTAGAAAMATVIVATALGGQTAAYPASTAWSSMRLQAWRRR